MRKLADLERECALQQDRDHEHAAAPVQGVKNYITPAGYERLKHELAQLLDKERPELVRVIAWAASNGDRSENADYIYGKRRLRDIDHRIRLLTKRLELVEVIDPARGRVSWSSPVARALAKAREGDVVTLKTPAGIEELEVLEVRYLPLP